MAFAMKRYQLKLKMIPAESDGGIVLPTIQTLAVTGQLDMHLNEVWMAFVWAANRGRFGPFTAADLLNINAEMVGPAGHQAHLAFCLEHNRVPTPPLSLARAHPRLRLLVGMGLIAEA